MARKKKVKPKFELLVQPFNPERPDKFGMRMAVPVRPKPRKKKKKNCYGEARSDFVRCEADVAQTQE